MSSVDHKPSIPQYKMKAFSAIWTFGWVLVVIGIVSSDPIGYPGRGALLAYSPARGEFPVQSLFGRGYFSYIDESGNSRIINLEPNPLLGVRVSANGLPQIEYGRSIDLEQQQVNDGGQVRIVDNVKQDRLKPIKEFDENPFADSLDQRDVIQLSTTASDGLKLDSNKDSLSFIPTASMPKEEEQIFLYLPPTPTVAVQDSPNLPAEGTARQAIFNPQNPFLPPNSGLALPNPLPPMNAGAAVSNPTLTPNLPSSINMGPVVLKPFPPTSLGQVLPKPLPAVVLSTPPPDIVFPNSPLLSTSTPAPTIVSPIFNPGNPFLPSRVPVSSNPSPPVISQGVLLNPTPPPSSFNPCLQQSNIPAKPPSWIAPAVVRPTPQFNPDKNNPFLPSLGRVDVKPDIPTTTQENFPLIDIKSLLKPSSSQHDIPTPALDQAAPAEQIKDTPEVEQAKREHFLAHELALTRLEMARQPGDDNNHQEDESPSPLILASDSSSVYLMTDAASHQAVTSGPSTAVITEQTKLVAAESDGGPQVLPVV